MVTETGLTSLIKQVSETGLTSLAGVHLLGSPPTTVYCDFVTYIELSYEQLKKIYFTCFSPWDFFETGSTFFLCPKFSGLTFF